MWIRIRAMNLYRRTPTNYPCRNTSRQPNPAAEYKFVCMGGVVSAEEVVIAMRRSLGLPVGTAEPQHVCICKDRFDAWRKRS
jgi:hypothetical protein